MKRVLDPMTRKFYINKNSLIVFSFGVVYLFLNYTAFIRTDGVPGLLDREISTLDISWIVGLNWASALQLPWAKDSMVFTFGPLYYLEGYLLPGFHRYRTLLLVHAGMNLLFVFGFSYVFSLFIHLLESKTKWILVIVVILLGMQKPTLLLVPLLVAFISLPIIIPNEKITTRKTAIGRYIRYGIVSLLLALLPFTKFSHIYEAIGFMIVLTLALSYQRRFLDAISLGAFFVVFSLLIWICTSGEDLMSFLPYLQTRFLISGAYTEAMMLDFDQSSFFQIFILALLYLAALGLSLLYLLSTRQINWSIAWLLPLISLFLGFKASFVRADGHAYIFLNYVFLSALYYYYLVEFHQPEANTAPWRQSLGTYFVPFLAFIVFASYSLLGENARSIIKNEFLEVSRLIQMGPDSKVAYRESAQETLREKYRLDAEFLGQINRKESIDIIPWDIALLYGYELLWAPRPVLQSYASYTAELDRLDAEFFRGTKAPEQLIMALSTIDHRSAVFDNPATFLALLDTYDYAFQSSDGRYALLRKRQEPLFRGLLTITQKQYKFSEEISVPQEPDSHVFLSVEMEPSIMGKFRNVFYRPTSIFIEVTLQNGEVKRNRYIRDTGQNGLFISKYVENLGDLESVFDETYVQNVTSVRFLGDGSVYREPFKVQFYKMPFR